MNAEVDDYDWRSDLATVEACTSSPSLQWLAVQRLRSHFEVVERRAKDATVMLDKVKETVTKSEVRRRLVQAYRSGASLMILADASDATWLEEIAADAVRHTVELAVRTFPRAPADMFEVVRVAVDEDEEGDWLVRLNTLSFERTPSSGALLEAHVVSERGALLVVSKGT